MTNKKKCGKLWKTTKQIFRMANHRRYPIVFRFQIRPVDTAEVPAASGALQQAVRLQSQFDALLRQCTICC